jgi:F0F1-type ATP synthase membrane subunit c/vacuolar-type H+-ATPase subunit K
VADKIASAFVEVEARLANFDDQVRSGTSGAFERVERAASQSGENIQDAFREAARQSGDALDRLSGAEAFNDVERQAESTGESIQRSFTEAARQSEQKLDGIGSHFKGIAVGIGGALAGLGLGAFVASSVNAATEAAAGFRTMEQVIQATGQAAGLTAEQVADVASNLSLKIGVDDDEIIAAQSVLLTFKNVTGDTFTTATSLAADMSAVFGQDLSASATQLGKALNDPVAGVSALSRIGIQFTEDQKAMIASFLDVFAEGLGDVLFL